MKTLSISTLIVFFIFTILNCSCSTYGPGNLPKDTEIQEIVNDFNTLANKRGIRFKKIYTVKLNPFNREDNAVGLCYRRISSRKIELEMLYWTRSSELSRRYLLYHELAHCLCDRDHDFDKGQKYKVSYAKNLVDSLVIQISKIVDVKKENGYFSDGCPTSIMYPYTISDSCTRAHSEHYDSEMFDRCDPW